MTSNEGSFEKSPHHVARFDHAASDSNTKPVEGTNEADLFRATYEQSPAEVKREDKRLAKSFEQAEIDRFNQSNKLRTPFMASALGMAGLLVLSLSVCMVVLALKGNLDPQLGIAISVSFAGQVIGIVGIVAHYLFSTPRTHFDKQSSDDEDVDDTD
ncbi:hypothetical protein [Corynebacterium sp. CQ3829_602738]